MVNDTWSRLLLLWLDGSKVGAVNDFIVLYSGFSGIFSGNPFRSILTEVVLMGIFSSFFQDSRTIYWQFR
jgi:hypothetical protein